MATHQILLGGEWVTEATDNHFSASNPSTGDVLEDCYPVSSLPTLKRMASKASEAARILNHLPADTIALFLNQHANEIDANRIHISHIAHAETGLPLEPRLVETEMNRTIDQLRQAARCVIDRSWMQARIDSQLNIRSIYEPVGGAVLTIGPNNFPLAYNGAAGGDFAAAIAARNPVIAKGHQLHPGTSRVLAECADRAAKAAGLPPGSFQFFYQCDPEDGLSLVRMPEVTGVGFTGSRKAGLSLKQAADETGTPIYLELSSINPIFVLPEALAERATAIGTSIAKSMLAASGQQCTCPGLLVVQEGPRGEELQYTLCKYLGQTEPQVMLSRGGVEHLHKSIMKVINAGAELLLGGQPVTDSHAKYKNTLLRICGEQFLNQPDQFQQEMFGVAALIIQVQSDEEYLDIARVLDGNLTGTIHRSSSPSDDPLTQKLEAILRNKVGRLIHDDVPTGVSVNAATVHGGPFPATGHPGFTAVGMPTAIHRFCALRCYDRVRSESLPPELRDKNPTGNMLRFVDGEWTNRDVVRA